jgi:ABC-type branched-subunit amino acid transport system permease subunit
VVNRSGAGSNGIATSPTRGGIPTITDYLLFGILGLGSGAVVSFIAVGIVLAYRGSGVINFAQGAMAMYCAYVFVALRRTGRYLLPVPGLPGFIDVGPAEGMALAPSVVITLVTAVLLGLLVHFLVFRPLRHAPTLAKVAASIGLMLVLQSIVAYRFGTQTLSVPPVLPTGTAFKLSGVLFPVDRLILAGAGIAAGVACWALLRYTRFGLATRAAAENERGATLLGYSPDFHAGVCWVLATLLAAIGGILVAPLTDLTPTGFTLLIIPALAAALIGRFTSFGVTVAAALLIGVLQNELTNLPNKFSWVPSVGLPEALPFLLIIVVMFVVGKSLPERGTAIEGRLQTVPQARRMILAPAVVLAMTVVALYVVSAAYRAALINSMIGAVLCLSLVVITGYVGQISLLQMALAGLAGYMLAGLTTGMGIPFPLAPILAALGAMVVGLVAALPALRVRGVNLAVVTLAAGWAIERFVFNNPDYTGGFEGASVPPPEVFGVEVPFSSGRTIAQPSFGVFVLGVLALLAIAVSNLRRSETGRRLLAVRTNERAAASMGVNVARAKFVAFAISSFIAGIAGCLIAYQQTHISASTFTSLASIALLAIAFLGGITTVAGAMVGGLLFAGGLLTVVFDDLIFSRATNGLALQDLIGGIGLIVTAILNPEGIAGAVRLTAHQMGSRFRSGRPPAAHGGEHPAPTSPALTAG